jgi:succinate dehydrogenase / fumarate reductase flavoprotein subunit
MMQCLADGYFIVPHTVTDYLSGIGEHPDATHPAFDEAERSVRDRIGRLLGVGGSTPATVFHRELGNLMLDRCGITRDAEGLRDALGRVAAIREEFWRDLRITDGDQGINQALEYAGRVADFLELAELMCRDALERDESCGCHLREEHQSEDGDPLRDDEEFAHVAVWEHGRDGEAPVRHAEPLEFRSVTPVQRSYK